MIGWISRTATSNPFQSPHSKPVAERLQENDEVRIAGMDAPGDHGAANRDDRADRKVDAFRADDDRHAERHHRGRHGAIEDVDQVAEQPALDDADAEKAGRDEPVDHQDQRQRQRWARSSGGPDERPSARAGEGRPFGGAWNSGRSFVHAPAIVSMIFSRVISAPSISPTFLRSRSTADPMADRDEFVEFGGGDEQRQALRAKVADQVDDFRVRADVDAARRLVEDQHARARRPARAPGSLSADCRRRAGRPACPRPASRSPASRSFRARAAPARARDRRRSQPRLLCKASTMFSRTVSSRDDAFALAILGAERHAVAKRSPRARARRPRCRRCGFRRCRGAARRTPAWRFRFGPSRAGPRGPTTSPARSSMSNGAMTRRRPTPFADEIGSPFDSRVAQRRPLLGALEFVPDHHRHELAATGISAIAPDADAAAVAQHGDPVGDLIDLIEEMGDEDDREAAPLQVAQDVEQPLRSRWRRGSRSARRAPARARRPRARGRSRPVAGWRRNRSRAGARRRCRGRAAPSARARVSARARQSTKPKRRGSRPSVKVLRHRHRRNEIDFLIDARRSRRRARRPANSSRMRRPSSRIIAGVRSRRAGHDLDQRRFAGAVLAQQRMHLAGFDAEIDVVERPHAGIGFRHADEFDPRGQGVVSSRFCRMEWRAGARRARIKERRLACGDRETPTSLQRLAGVSSPEPPPCAGRTG